MNVLVVGANGKIGKFLVTLLGDSNEHDVTAMIRDSEQAEGLEAKGARPLIADLEKDISGIMKGYDTVIFTAGSGPHTGADKTILVDLDGAFKVIDEAEKENIDRFVMISSFYADEPAKGSDAIRHYNVAKQRADERLENSSLNYTIIRPGRLTDDPGTGKIAADERLEVQNQRQIPREDVAKTVVTALDLEETFHRSVKIVSGEQSIYDALKSLPSPVAQS